MKLYIIGNGFDIAHGLDTSYWAFRMYLEDKYPTFLQRFEEMYNIVPLDPSEYGYTQEVQEHWNDSVNNKLWSIFEEEMGNPDISNMIDISSSILSDLDLEGGHEGIRDTMDDYWKNEYGFVEELQKYVNEWITQVDISQTIPQKNSLIEDDSNLYFSFNYTNLLETVYKVTHVLHIHGSTNEENDDPPFMGHCNKELIQRHKELSADADNERAEGEASIHSAIANYLEAIYKDTNWYISLNSSFFERLANINEVIIFGWSAGRVDIPYLCKIRDSVSKATKWTIYYYDDTAYNDLYSALLNNGIIGNYRTEFLMSDLFWTE